jgi:2-polyprenyl-3-methyl-5-hydroxy-6-metoxy-1,4-benzoquinol methylase
MAGVRSKVIDDEKHKPDDRRHLWTLLQQRATGSEFMDGSDFGKRQVRDTFSLLVPVNRRFGGIRPQLLFFQRESKGWDRERTYHILDVGCGAGDMAVALVRWARRAEYNVQVDGVDRHPLIVDLARERCRDYPEIQITQGNVLELDGCEHDYVHASQFVHHFPNDQVVPLLRHLLAMSRCKLIICDLMRLPLAYLSTWLFTLWTTPVFRHDARLSVRRGFKTGELEALLKAGGLSHYSVEKHFFYRFLLVMNARTGSAPKGLPALRE